MTVYLRSIMSTFKSPICSTGRHFKSNYVVSRNYSAVLSKINIQMSETTKQARHYSKNVQNEASSATAKGSDAKAQSGSKKKTLEGGVVITDIIVGDGDLAKSGKTISVYYSGKLKNSTKSFDEVTDGPGLTFRLGRGDVIDGWDVGVVGMKVGGKRIITCPPGMAYGAQGYPPVIPPNSTLVFEVELKSVK